MTDHQPETEDQNQGFIVGAFLGAIAGSVAALLLTPKTGPEMRSLVKEHAQDLEAGTSNLTHEAHHLATSLLEAISEFSQNAPEMAHKVGHQTSQVAGTLEDSYHATKDSVSEMMESFKSQWQEMEDAAPAKPAQPVNSRFRGVHRQWPAEAPAAKTDSADRQENQAYIEALHHNGSLDAEVSTDGPIELENPNQDDSETKPTLAEYRRRTAQESPTSSTKSSTRLNDEPTPARPAEKSKSEVKPAKVSSHRKLFFRKK